MLATLRLGDGAGDAGIFVPLAAIVRPAGDSAGLRGVRRARFGGRRPPGSAGSTLGEVSGNQIAVREGLEPGERVIVRGATIVADGQSVRVMP